MSTPDAVPLSDLVVAVAAARQRYDHLRAERVAHALASWEHSRDLELTYTSNALEGNTLTAFETTLVVEQGVTIAGKPLKDHLEAIDHAEALEWVHALAGREADGAASGPLTAADLRSLHHLVVRRSLPDAAGRYADSGRYILTDSGRHQFPPPGAIPGLVDAFIAELAASPPGAMQAIAAHRQLVAIHPFRDGNGRTARLLMNLLLLRAGYPPVAIHPADRPAYLRALAADQAGEGPEAFDRLMHQRLLATLDEACAALEQALLRSA